MKYLIILYLFMIVLGCGEDDNYQIETSKIKKFDEQYSQQIIKICNRLMQLKELDTSYALSKHKSETAFFNYINDSGQNMGFFTPNFEFNSIERNLLFDTKIGRLVFIKRDSSFFISSFYFIQGDTTVDILVSFKKSQYKNLKRKLYQTNQLIYYKAAAW